MTNVVRLHAPENQIVDDIGQRRLFSAYQTAVVAYEADQTPENYETMRRAYARYAHASVSLAEADRLVRNFDKMHGPDGGDAA